MSQAEKNEKPSYYPSGLPFRVWCACGHISGQHAAKFPHVCACDGNVNGSVCACRGFQAANEGQRKLIERIHPYVYREGVFPGE